MENEKDCWKQSNLGDSSVIYRGDAKQDRHSYNLKMANTAISEGDAVRVGNYRKKSILQNKLHPNPMSITLKPFSHPCFCNIQCWEGLSLGGKGGLVFSNPVRLLCSGIIYYRTKFSTLTVHCYWKEWQTDIILVLCKISVMCQHLQMWYSNSWDVFQQGRPQSCKQKGLFPST